MAGGGGSLDGGMFQPTPSYTLDDFIEIFKIEPPNHIKIDVDGHELNVLFGAKKTLLNPKLRSMLVEIDEALPASKDIYKIIEEAGFYMISKHKRAAEATFNCIFARKG